MHSLVTFIFLYACESWILRVRAEFQRRIQAMEIRCYCKILHISYKRPCYQQGSLCQGPAAIRPYKDWTITKRLKLKWFDVSHSSGVTRIFLQGTVKGERRQGRWKKQWEDNIR